MAEKISRRRLADYVASHTRDGRIEQSVIDELAAYLVDSGRTRELENIVKAVEDELQQRGIVVAKLISAYPLSKAVKEEIKSKIPGEKVLIQEKIDESLIGGINLVLPDSQLDQSVKTKLKSLRAQKI